LTTGGRVPPVSLVLRGGNLLRSSCRIVILPGWLATDANLGIDKWGLGPTAPAGPGPSPGLSRGRGAQLRY
jgi:hypothetical protein